MPLPNLRNQPSRDGVQSVMNKSKTVTTLIPGFPESKRSNKVVSALFGATGLAAIAVLISVYLGAPTAHPIQFILAMGAAGGGLGALIGDRVRHHRTLSRVYLVVWAALILLAAVYVVAAIAISNFE